MTGPTLPNGWAKVDSAPHVMRFERETPYTFESIVFHAHDDDLSFRVVEKEDGSKGAAVGLDFAGVRAILDAIASTRG